MRAAVNAVVAGELDPFPLLTHSIPLETLGRGLELMHDRPDGFIKGWTRICDSDEARR